MEGKRRESRFLHQDSRTGSGVQEKEEEQETRMLEIPLGSVTDGKVVRISIKEGQLIAKVRKPPYEKVKITNNAKIRLTSYQAKHEETKITSQQSSREQDTSVSSV